MRPETGRKQNLTLQSLPPLIADARLRTSVEEHVESALAACQDTIVWRNRRLAHRDLGVAIGAEKESLPEIPFASVDVALTSFEGLLNVLEAHFNNGARVEYQMIGLSMRADSLIYFLEKGLGTEA